jgi:hypothetical protein
MQLRQILIALSLPALMHAGCSADDARDGTTIDHDGRVGAIGKADHVSGSCASLSDGAAATCGGQADNGSCYCDALCASYGDCCNDAAELCEVDECTDAGAGCHEDDSCVVAPAIMCITAPCPQPPNTCDGGGEQPASCESLGGSCLSSPLDVTFPADCGADFGMQSLDGSCEAFNRACCKPMSCGGFAGMMCSDGQLCVDNPGDDCDPQNGGADCMGICVPDDADGDDREPASGQCVRNSNDACETDADCGTGGCGGELCFNPSLGGGFTTCDCVTPTDVGGCGCIAGQCSWYN